MFHQLRVWPVVTSVGGIPGVLAPLASGSLYPGVPVFRWATRGQIWQASPILSSPQPPPSRPQLCPTEQMSALVSLFALKFFPDWNPDPKPSLLTLDLHHRTTGWWEQIPDQSHNQKSWEQMFWNQSSYIPCLTLPCLDTIHTQDPLSTGEEILSPFLSTRPTANVHGVQSKDTVDDCHIISVTI